MDTREPLRLAMAKAWLPASDETANFVFSVALRHDSAPHSKPRKRDRDRAEALRLAGGPKPTLREMAVNLAKEKATVRTKEFTAIGVHRCYLARMCEESLLEKVSFGVYRVGRKAA